MPEPYTPQSALIVVCCHAIFLGPSTQDLIAGSDESGHWLIEAFQEGETPTFIQHIEAGVQQLRNCLARGDDALLVFSGGATKRARGCTTTEGQGYLVSSRRWRRDERSHCGIDMEEWVGSVADKVQQNLALARNLFGFETDPPSLRPRMFAETFATDSYQNVLLSLIQYPLFARQYLKGQTGQLIEDRFTLRWPEKLIIVSHQFKKPRFLDLHLPAIKAPTRRIEYVGIDPPFDEAKLAQVVEGDKLRGYGVWKDDPYGIGPLLQQKRLLRGWDEAAFIDQVLQDEALWDGPGRKMLIALLKGGHGASWPV